MPTQSIRTGVAAHITAASPKGPRYDENMTQEERSNVGNGVWMCQICARVIDIAPNVYTVEFLRAIKVDAEKRAARATFAEDEISKLVIELQDFRDNLLAFITQQAIDEPEREWAPEGDEEARSRAWRIHVEESKRHYERNKNLYESLIGPQIMALLPRLAPIFGRSDPFYLELEERAEHSAINRLAQKDLARYISSCISLLELR